MPTITSDELACLRGTASRFRLYIALWDSWQIAQFSLLGADPETGDPLPAVSYEVGDFADVIVMGTHRLAFAGESITVDATRSWTIGGAPGSAASGDWTLTGSNEGTLSGPGPHEVTWSTPGLYPITYANATGRGDRYVRVVANRDAQPFDVISVGSPSGGTDGGWSAEIVCAPTWGSGGNDPNEGVRQFPQLADFQRVGIFCEEEWRVNGVWQRRPIGSHWSDPMLLMAGYVTQGTISVNASSNQVTFRIGGLKEQMEACTIHRTSVWGRTQYDVYRAEHSDAVAGDAPTSGGAILELEKTTIADVMLWLLEANTDILGECDFESWYASDQQDWLNISGSEGSIWSVAGSWTEGEYAWLWVDQANGLHVEPNYHIRSIGTYAARHPVRMHITESDVLMISPGEDKSRNVIFVKINGEVPARGKMYTVSYPDDEPPSGAGTWLTRSDLLISNRGFLVAIAPRLYLDANRRWTASLTLGQCRAIEPGDRVQLTLASFDHDINWVSKEFICRQVSYSIDVASQLWRTTIAVEEVL